VKAAGLNAVIVTSKSSPVDIPDVTVPAFVLRHADRLAGKPALIDGPTGRTLTYGQLADATRRVATALHRRGLRKGDVVLVFSHNVPEYAVVFNAVASLGATVSTANPLYTSGELARQLRDCRPRFLMTAPPFLAKAREAAAGSSIEEIYVFGGGTDAARAFDELLDAPAAPPQVSIDPAGDIVVLPYSSGTTGLPKGVMLTHRNLVANLCQINGAADFDAFQEHDRILAVLPLFHIYGMVVVMMLGLSNGATIVTLPRFDLEDFLATIQKYRITNLPIVPPILLAMVKSPLVDRYDVSSVRLVFSGAAPLGEIQARQLAERIGCQVRQGYGMTEASPVTHISPTRVGVPAKVGSAGRVVPNTEVQIVDPVQLTPAAGPNVPGELWIRGPQIMKGYLGQPGETAASLDEEGWYHTGDVGYVDEDGWFFVVDRTKELIKYKGMQVAPAELEALLLTHPAVLDVAVVRRPDEEAGEIPKAFVVLKRDAESQVTTGEDLMAWVAERVAPHKRVRLVEFVEQIPKSPSGKILRRLLVDGAGARC
jgi:acyl-CoA synthetase (AMP-forming)/AMP-acid ligase II